MHMAEQRMLSTHFAGIRCAPPPLIAHNTANPPCRTWVCGRAQHYVDEYFKVLFRLRRDAHKADMKHFVDHAKRFYGSAPDPRKVADASADFERGMNEDWCASVRLYPQVLEYFYGLVDFKLPDDDDPAVADPQMDTSDGARMRGGAAPRAKNERAGIY